MQLRHTAPGTTTLPCLITSLTKRNQSLMLLVRLSVVLFAFLGFAGLAHGQGFGSIVGTVKDPSGASIPDAKVTATETGKGFSRSATTYASGN